jgi:L-arabonate dehydrase
MEARTAENVSGRETCYNREVIAAYDEPLLPHAGIAVVKGNPGLMAPSSSLPPLLPR